MAQLTRLRKKIEKMRLRFGTPWLSDEDIERWGELLIQAEDDYHYSSHRMQQDESYAPWLIPDPVTAAGGNTTAGAGQLPYTFNGQQTLRSVNSSTAEIRTMTDPNKAFISIGMTLFQRTAQNLVVRFNTPIWLGATVTQPSLTQFGQYITFTTINHSIQIISVPCVSGTSFAGTQVNPTVNNSGYRWMLVQSDGPALS